MRGELFVLGALVVTAAALGAPVLETDTMRVEFGPDAEGLGFRRHRDPYACAAPDCHTGTG